jgi:hypothetical protein
VPPFRAFLPSQLNLFPRSLRAISPLSTAFTPNRSLTPLSTAFTQTHRGVGVYLRQLSVLCASTSSFPVLCVAYCFHNLTNPLRACPPPLRLNFHQLTNPLAGKSPVFTSIQNAGVWHPPVFLEDPRGVTRPTLPSSRRSDLPIFRLSDDATRYNPQLNFAHRSLLK